MSSRQLIRVVDFFAHSNYCELALIELGERDIFPHCGRNTRMELEGAREEVYPIVTGTFGGVDFLHSVTGEGKIGLYTIPEAIAHCYQFPTS
jgi:hypothetical protein